VEGDEVGALFIHPDWRGQGIGRHLFTYAVETLGATKVDVNEQNDQAVGFYQRMGFEVVGRSEDDGLGQPFPLLHMRLNKATRTG
jgi:putative acetyltransferase